MKKLLAFLLVLMMSLPSFACPAFAEQAKVMASFYPMYVFALNVFDGIDEIAVECMTAPQTGCLHDYQLVVSDMMKLAESDLFIVCGAGMEAYLPDVKQQFAALPIVDCSEGITLMEECEESHESHDHEHTYNAHTWLDVDNAITIVNTIASVGAAQFPQQAEKILDNADAYIVRLTALKEELALQLSEMAGKKIVTFHEAFPYFAAAYGIEIAAVITQEHDEALSPSQIASVIRIIKENGVPPLFTEPQYASSAAQTIALETGAAIYELDPIVTGNAGLTAYEDGMRKNAQTILEAFQ